VHARKRRRRRHKHSQMRHKTNASENTQENSQKTQSEPPETPPRAQILRMEFRTSDCPCRCAPVAHQSETLGLVGQVDDQGDFCGRGKMGARGKQRCFSPTSPTGPDQRGARRQGALALQRPRATRSSTPQGSFCGGLRVFGWLRRFFVCCNRVGTTPPKPPKKHVSFKTGGSTHESLMRIFEIGEQKKTYT